MKTSTPYRSEYYQKNRERIRAAQRRYESTPIAHAKRRERESRRYQANKININAYHRDWRKSQNRCGLYSRLRAMRDRYGVTETAFWQMWTAQNGCCAICGCALSLGHPRQDTAVTIDHDHDSGKVRGLLCRRHNLLLGHADDKIDMLQRAIKYLQNEGVE
jgi:hypothetical protein